MLKLPITGTPEWDANDTGKPAAICPPALLKSGRWSNESVGIYAKKEK